MNTIIEKKVRTCLECLEKIAGRKDKKFCCDQCRTSHYNKVHAEENSMVKKINTTLKKNRKILEYCFQNKCTKLSRTQLLQAGFDFFFFTHERILKSNNAYRFCYEYGYMEKESSTITIIRNEGEIRSIWKNRQVKNISYFCGQRHCFSTQSSVLVSFIQKPLRVQPSFPADLHCNHKVSFVFSARFAQSRQRNLVISNGITTGNSTPLVRYCRYSFVVVPEYSFKHSG